jgi:hypothetical protein
MLRFPNEKAWNWEEEMGLPRVTNQFTAPFCKVTWGNGELFDRKHKEKRLECGSYCLCTIRARFRSSDLWVMGPPRFRCATLMRMIQIFSSCNLWRLWEESMPSNCCFSDCATSPISICPAKSKQLEQHPGRFLGKFGGDPRVSNTNCFQVDIFPVSWWNWGVFCVFL